MSKQEELVFPSNYQRIKQDYLEGLGIPEEATGYEMHTNRTNGIFVNYPVSEEITMPFDDPQEIIDELHKSMDDNTGLIEVKNGTTAAGRDYIYEIIKHLMVDDKDQLIGVEYTVNMNIRMENTIQFINASFAEAGITGMRDSLVAAAYAEENNISFEETMKQWFEDPYDSDYKTGFLMNYSEREEFDGEYPWHALSEARSLVKYIIDNN